MAHPGRARGRAGRGGGRQWGRLGYPGARSGCTRRRRLVARTAGGARDVERCSRCRGSAATPPRPWPASPSASGTRCWTRTCGGCWRGLVAGQQRPARVAFGGGAAAGRIAAPGRARGGGPLVGRGDGTRRAGLHAPAGRVRRLPGGRRCAWRRGRAAPGRRAAAARRRSTRAPTGSAGGAARGAARGRRSGAPGCLDAVWTGEASWTGRWTGWWPTAWSIRCPTAARAARRPPRAMAPGGDGVAGGYDMLAQTG